MARRWTPEEERSYHDELHDLYVTQNKSISEIGAIVGITYKGVFGRLKRLGIPTNPQAKSGYANTRRDVRFPERTPELAEFFGIMLGDGNLTPTQIAVTLGTKEENYVQYVATGMQALFGANPRVTTNAKGHWIVYFGSVLIVRWLTQEGLVQNKVAAQVGVPEWIFTKPEYMQRFVRGFFDTDGSIYRLRFGIQISLTNHSLPLLRALHAMLTTLGYNPSAISAWRIYVTRRKEIERFFREIKPQNIKHKRRFDTFRASVG